MRLSLAVGMVSLACAGVIAQESTRLDVRFSPGNHVYLAQDNRNFALANFVLQNIAIVNTGKQPVVIDEVLIEVLVQDEVVRTERLGGRLLSQRWSRLKAYLDGPGVMVAEDARYRFKELLGDQIRLAASPTLAPGTAIYVARRFYFADAVVEVVDGKPRPIFPDRVRVSAIGATVAGQPVRATGEIRVISYQPRNEYHFPLSGRWYVASSSSVRSHHRSLPVHEFALDLIQVGEGGQSFRGEGTAHSDYYAFGKDVLAIGDGVVVAVYDDVPETRLRRRGESPDEYRRAVMEPLSTSARAAYATGGNQIVVEHPGQEFSTYAHLKAASVRVKKGDHVQRGQPIAQVGLSGDGYQPHLHVQLTDSRDANYARGIPLIFANVRPILFSSTIDIDGRRQLQAGEFIETIK